MSELSDMVNKGIETMVPVAWGMGVRVVELTPNTAVAEVPLPGNTNHFGAMYAGVLFTVAEVLGGAIALAGFDVSRYYPVLKDLQINFRKPATTTVRATTTLSPQDIAAVTEAAEQNGKADFTLDAELTDTNGVRLATTHGLYQLRRHGT